MSDARHDVAESSPTAQLVAASLSYSGRFDRYDIVRLVLAAVLLLGAALKGHQLASSPVIEHGVFSSRWFLISVVEFELAVALWLIGGQYPGATRRAAIAVFALFALVSMAHVVRGEASCGCFGSVSVSPWLTAAFDTAAVAALLASKPSRRIPRMCLRRLALTAVASLVTVPATAAWMSTHHWSILGDAGIAGGNLVVVLEPQMWLGMRFPLFPYIDVARNLHEGRWVVLLYHHDCPQCQQAIVRLATIAAREPRSSDHVAIALIEIPPVVRETRVVDPVARSFVHGQLDSSHEWFVTTPVEIHLADGIVHSVFGAAELANDPQLPDGRTLGVGIGKDDVN